MTAFLINDSNIPTTTSAGDYSLGLELKLLVAGQITGARYYHLSGVAAIPRPLRIYSGTGTLLGTTNNTVETDTLAAWKYASLTTPINVAANDNIVVVYDTFNLVFGWNTVAPTFVNPSLQNFVTGRFGQPSGLYPTNTGLFYYGLDLEYNPGALPPAGGAQARVMVMA